MLWKGRAPGSSPLSKPRQCPVLGPCLHPPDASVIPTPAAVCCQVSPRANADTESEGLGETDPREGGMCQRTRCS